MTLASCFCGNFTARQCRWGTHPLVHDDVACGLIGPGQDLSVGRLAVIAQNAYWSHPKAVGACHDCRLKLAFHEFEKVRDADPFRLAMRRLAEGYSYYEMFAGLTLADVLQGWLELAQQEHYAPGLVELSMARMRGAATTTVQGWCFYQPGMGPVIISDDGRILSDLGHVHIVGLMQAMADCLSNLHHEPLAS